MKRVLWFVLFILMVPNVLFAEGLKSFTLKNGLSVFIWEDSTQSDVFGMIAVKAGSVDDPEQHTGLAHYLEHVMFKGTERIGALDWPKEKTVYDQIISKYDELAKESDPIKKATIDKEINELSITQSQLSISNEFSTLIESIGGTGLNAGTSFDRTLYHNSFPEYQLERWLDLYSSRLINPIFRTFQAELENVYEEYNMYQDNRSSQINNFILSNSFAGHPYGRPVIGFGEHLKNPQLSKLIEFYNKYYVPGNMALILSGNIKTEDAIRTIVKKFGRLENKPLTLNERKPAPVIEGRKVVSANIGDYPRTVLVFNAVPEGHEDYLTLQVALQILSNSDRTGLFDKLSINGDVMYADASLLSLADDGRILVMAVPTYDVGQKLFDSHKSVEKLLMEQINKLKAGNIEDWLLTSIKDKMCRTNDLKMESPSTAGSILADAFICGLPPERIVNYDSIIQSITKKDIFRVLTRYLNEDVLAIHIDQGKDYKKDKMPVSERNKSIESSLGSKSTYRTWFETISTGKVDENYADFSDVMTARINEKSKLFFMPNTVNDVFSLTIKFGAGKRVFPKLDMSVSLMNDAGVMAAFEPQEFKKELSMLNATCNYSYDDDYTYVTVYGDETKLKDICNLITRQILMPKLDAKQFNNMIGQMIQSRNIEKDQTDVVEDALKEYLLYGQKSDYIDRLTEAEILEVNTSELIGDFQRATNYAAEVHYVGRRAYKDVLSVLTANLPLKLNEKDSESPQMKPRVKYNENHIYFLPDKDVNQSEIFFYVEGPEYLPDSAASITVFNQYFDGGFGGLVLNEIREKNSMAYHASGKFEIPMKNGEQTYFFGQLGTQNEKVSDAIGLYLNLVNEMPKVPERMETMKDYIHKSLFTNKPSFRYASQVYESYKILGFHEDPAKTIVPAVEKMSFDDIMSFYLENLKGKPIAIGIVGNPRIIDLKGLEKYGKVERLSVSELFK